MLQTELWCSAETDKKELLSKDDYLLVCYKFTSNLKARPINGFSVVLAGLIVSMTSLLQDLHTKEEWSILPHK